MQRETTWISGGVRFHLGNLASLSNQSSLLVTMKANTPFWERRQHWLMTARLWTAPALPLPKEHFSERGLSLLYAEAKLRDSDTGCRKTCYSMQGDQPCEISPPTDQGAPISSFEAIVGSIPFPPMTADIVLLNLPDHWWWALSLEAVIN